MPVCVQSAHYVYVSLHLFNAARLHLQQFAASPGNHWKWDLCPTVFILVK